MKEDEQEAWTNQKHFPYWQNNQRIELIWVTAERDEVFQALGTCCISPAHFQLMLEMSASLNHPVQVGDRGTTGYEPFEVQAMSGCCPHLRRPSTILQTRKVFPGTCALPVSCREVFESESPCPAPRRIPEEKHFPYSPNDRKNE